MIHYDSNKYVHFVFDVEKEGEKAFFRKMNRLLRGERLPIVSTTGEMPWDGLIDDSLYIKTQVKIETTVYEVK